MYILTIQVLDFSPMKESLSTLVRVLSLNGTWSPFLPRDRIHSCGSESNMLFRKNPDQINYKNL